MLSEVGFPHATIREIASRANVNPALLHYYFGTKSKLHEAVMTQIAEEFRERMEKLPTEGSVRARLERLILAYSESVLESPWVVRILVQDLMIARDERGGDPTQLARVFVQALSDLVDEGLASGELREMDSLLLTSTIASTCLALALASEMLSGVAGGEGLTNETWPAALPSLVWEGVGAEGPDSSKRS